MKDKVILLIIFNQLDKLELKFLPNLCGHTLVVTNVTQSHQAPSAPQEQATFI